MLTAESEATMAAKAVAEAKRVRQLERRRAADRLRAFLDRGGVLIREDLGGAIGLRWGRAHRSGAAFDTRACERLLEQDKLMPALGCNAHAFVRRRDA